MDISRPKDASESSDEEVFFGEIGEKEQVISKRIFRRKTDAFSASFRIHNNTAVENSDDDSVACVTENLNDTLNLNLSEDSLDLKIGAVESECESLSIVQKPLGIVTPKTGDDVSLLKWCTMSKREAYDPTPDQCIEHKKPLGRKLSLSFDKGNFKDLSLLLENSLNLRDNSGKEENNYEMDVKADVSTMESSPMNSRELFLPLENSLNLSENPGKEDNDYEMVQMDIKPDVATTLSTPMKGFFPPIEKEPHNSSKATMKSEVKSPFSKEELESSPEADYFDPYFSFPQPQRLSFQSPRNIIEALDLSRGALTLTTPKPEPSSPPHLNSATSIASLNLHTSTTLSNEATKENVSPINKKKHHLMEGESKRPRGLYWSPKPTPPIKRSHIPLPEKGSSKDKRRFRTPNNLKKWDVVSPIGQYIRNQPPPPLFKTVKPLRDIPIDRTALSSNNADVFPKCAGKVDRSPTVLKLPTAKYHLKGQKASNSYASEISSKGIGCSSIPKVIRHKGPSKAIHYSSHLASNQSLLGSPNQIFQKLEVDTSVNKSVMEFVPLHRTDTIILPKKLV